MLNLGTAYASIEVRLNRLESGLADAERKFAATGKKIDGEAQKLNRNLSQSFNDIGRRLTIGLTAPLAALGTAAVKAAVDMDSLKRGLRSVAGSSAETERQLKRLEEVAKLPGLGFKEAIAGATRLQAAGISAQTAERALLGFGNALATVGRGKAELDGVILALSQIQSKGKVSAEEINQIAERVPQIRRVMQDAFGTADTEIIQNAKISSKEFIDVITNAMNELPRVAGGAKNAFENFGDAADKALTSIGNTLLPAITRALEKFTPVLEGLAKDFANLGDGAKTAFGGLALALAAGGPILMGLGAVKKAIEAIGAAPALKLLLRFGGIPAAVAGGAYWLGTQFRQEEDPRRAEALRRTDRLDREANRPRDEMRRLQELQNGIAQFNQRRSIINRYPAADRSRLFAQNQERISEMRQIMGEAEIRGKGGAGSGKIDAAARAAAAEKAKQDAEESKRFAKEQAEARKRNAVEMAGFRSKFAGDRVQAQQDFRERIPLLGMVGASNWLKARLAVIATEENEEKKRLDEAHKRRLADAKKRTAEIEKNAVTLVRGMAKNLSAQADSIASTAGAAGRFLTKDEDDIDRIMRISEREMAAAYARGVAGQGAWLHGFSEAMVNSANSIASTIQTTLVNAGSMVQRMQAGGSYMQGMRSTFQRMAEGFASTHRATGGNIERSDKGFAEKVRRIEDNLRSSFGGILGQEIAYEFTDSFARGLEKAFGSSSIGKIFSRAITRWFDQFVQSAIERTIGGIANDIGGGGKKKGGGEKYGPMVGTTAGTAVGGPLGGIIGGFLGGMLGFSEGGLVPGRLGEPRPAIVHGGEFVVSRKMQEQGAMGAVTVNLGGVSVANDYDVDRLVDRIAYATKRRLAVNPGTF